MGGRRKDFTWGTKRALRSLQTDERLDTTKSKKRINSSYIQHEWGPGFKICKKSKTSKAQKSRNISASVPTKTSQEHSTSVVFPWQEKP